MGTSKNCGSKLKTRKSIIMKTKGKSSYYTYAALGICLACLPFLVVASQYEEDLIAEESKNIGILQQRAFPPQPIAVPTAQVPAVVAPPASSQASYPAATPFTIPKGDLAGAPSYSNNRFSVSSVNPYWDNFPSEVASFRRRAQDDDVQEDDYQPQESKGKKSAPSVLKRVGSTIRNTGKAIIGAPSYIYKRYRKYFGGSKKKKGWKSHSTTSDKNDGWGGWEEVEPSKGYDYDSSHYPSEKGWRSSSSKGSNNNNNGYSSYDSHERRNDRGTSNYRDYNRDNRDDYRDYDNREYSTRDRHERSRPRDRHSKYNSSYREETHYDDYDGRRTTAYYSPSRKSHSNPSSRRPYNGSNSNSSNSGGKGNYKYDDYH